MAVCCALKYHANFLLHFRLPVDLRHGPRLWFFRWGRLGPFIFLHSLSPPFVPPVAANSE